MTSSGNYISIGFGPDDLGMTNADNIIGTINSGFVIVQVPPIPLMQSLHFLYVLPLGLLVV